MPTPYNIMALKEKMIFFYLNSFAKDSNETFVEGSPDNSEEELVVDIVEDSLNMKIDDKIKGTLSICKHRKKS